MSSFSHDDDDEASLTEAQRARRNKRRIKRAQRQSMRSSLTLSDRVVMDPPGAGGAVAVITKEDRELADAKVLRNIAINACFIGLWYLFALLISVASTARPAPVFAVCANAGWKSRR